MQEKKNPPKIWERARERERERERERQHFYCEKKLCIK